MKLSMNMKVETMSYASNDGIKDDNGDSSFNDDMITDQKSEIDTSKIRKKIDELLEKKRLKELLDDTDDW